MKRAIVLSGGGARGSYQIGVWKALRKLRIKYDIITGSSVGALNGALMTQDTYFRGLWLWYNIKVRHIFKEKMHDDYTSKEGRKNLFKRYMRAIFIDHGMDVSNLEETIERILDEERIRESKINFGLITFNISNLKPITLVKKEIPKGKFKDYLIASATCFPAFKKKCIDDINYIDGGYYDILPINLAIDMGAEEIIAVDLKTLGIRRKIKNKNVKITYITPQNDLGSFLTFHKTFARRGIRLGYNDTMKVFDKLDGNKYTFKHNDLKHNIKKYESLYLKYVKRIFKRDEKENIITKLFRSITYKKSIQINDFNKTIEYLGKIFELDDSYIYNIKHFNRLIIYYFDKLPTVDRNLIDQKIKDKDIKGLLNNKTAIKYIYDKISDIKNTKSKKDLAGIALFLQKEFLGALYIYILKKYY
jgi:NTE family protein